MRQCNHRTYKGGKKSPSPPLLTFSAEPPPTGLTRVIQPNPRRPQAVHPPIISAPNPDAPFSPPSPKLLVFSAERPTTGVCQPIPLRPRRRGGTNGKSEGSSERTLGECELELDQVRQMNQALLKKLEKATQDAHRGAAQHRVDLAELEGHRRRLQRDAARREAEEPERFS